MGSARKRMVHSFVEYIENSILICRSIRPAAKRRRLGIGEGQVTNEAAKEHPQQYLVIRAHWVVPDDALAVFADAVDDPGEFGLGDVCHSAALSNWPPAHAIGSDIGSSYIR